MKRKETASAFVLLHLAGFLFVVASFGINPLRITRAFFSDEAVYYTMAYSFAHDSDMEFQRSDLIRVYKEFAAGPTGIILKINDRDKTIVFGKGFLYGLIAAPFVYLIGTNGFFLLNALLLWLNLLCGYRYSRAVMLPTAAATFTAFYFIGNASLVYLFWMTPEYFNMSLVCYAFFFFVSAETFDSKKFFFRSPYNYIIAALFFGLATYGKPTNAILIGPLGIWMLYRRKIIPALLALTVFVFATMGLFGINVYLTGEWNYQGGHRAAFYNRFPYENPGVSEFAPFIQKDTIQALVAPPFYWKAFLYNWVYFFFGRYSGLAIYFFPMFFSLLFFLFKKKNALSVAVYAAGWLGIFTYMIGLPWNYFGGSGTIGNRYLLNAFPVFLFAVTQQPSKRILGVGLGCSLLFTSAFLFSPVLSSFLNSFHQQSSVFRLLPVEKTLLGDLPINSNLQARRVSFEKTDNYFVYFLDDNTYYKEEFENQTGFWIKGQRSAEWVVRAFQPSWRVTVKLYSPVPNQEVTVRTADRQKTVTFSDIGWKEISLDLPGAIPYDRDGTGPTYLYGMEVHADSGRIVHSSEGEDRYWGVFVRLEIAGM